MGWGEPKGTATADVAPREPRSLTDTLFLSLRTCATHPAGPLRAVAEIVAAVNDGTMSRAEARQLCDDVEARYRGMLNVPADRLATVSAFLSALFT